MAKQCHQCKFYKEDNTVNWAGCEAENWPEYLTNEEVDEIIENDDLECPIFQISENCLVAPVFACKCGERRFDFLAWVNDEEVECLTCGNVYKP